MSGGGELELTFPAGRAAGRLRRYDDGTGEWVPLGPARGQVSVAAEAQLSLRIEPRQADLDFLDALPVRPFVRLRLAGVTLAPADYARLAQFCWLRELDLDGCRVDDTEVAALRPLVNLVELRLGGSLVDARGLDLLDFPLLRRLDLDHSAVAGNLGSLRRLPALERLDLSGTPLGDEGLGGIAELAGLRRLDVGHTDLGPAAVAALGRLTPGLVALLLCGVPIDARAASALGLLPELELLDVAGCELDDVDVVPLFRARRLTRLRLSNNAVGNTTAAWLEGLPTLTSLWLDDTDVSDAGLARLAGLPALAELVLDGTPVSSAGLAALWGHPSLRRLDLARTAVDDSGLAMLASLPSLEELDLSGTDVTDEGLAALAGCATLRSLRVAGARVTRRGVWRLVEALPELDLPELGLAPVAPPEPPQRPRETERAT